MHEDRLPTYGDYMIKLVRLLHELQRLARSSLIHAKLRSKL